MVEKNSSLRRVFHPGSTIQMLSFLQRCTFFGGGGMKQSELFFQTRQNLQKECLPEGIFN